MGQEIDTYRFTSKDFDLYRDRLRQETELLSRWFMDCKLSQRGPVAGFELEAWLIDKACHPAAINQEFLKKMGEPLVSPELAQFNIELNNEPRLLMGRALSELEHELAAIWAQAAQVAEDLDAHLLTIGILPTLSESELSPRYMSPLKRYRALNEQVLRSRRGRPLRLDIVGRQRLRSEHSDVMLESAATSFQIHLQAPCERSHRLYNAAIAISAPMVAAGANSPYLFDLDLWDETRIPLFEQSVEIGGFEGAAQGPLRRVSFGSGYARESILECFEENLMHFPVLLPVQLDGPIEHLSHLRLHNGTIWRWNRPLIGFDEDGTPHVRIEHRVLPGSPSIADAIANAALFYGLTEALCMDPHELMRGLPFAQAKDNFYQAARYGLSAQVSWFDHDRVNIRQLLLAELLPQARQGLARLGIETEDIDRYLGIIQGRLEHKQNGCQWQRGFVARHGTDRGALTRAYLERQGTGQPVHQWTL
jgi:gamma-glutamyl:cysteine ligase YbdK (ATP-grasp superfamily)